MFKKIALVGVLLLVLALCLGGAQAEDFWMLNAQAIVYADYNPSSIIAMADSGTIYTIIDSTQVQRWIKIAYNDPITGVYTEGWINESLLAVPSTSYTDAPLSMEKAHLENSQINEQGATAYPMPEGPAFTRIPAGTRVQVVDTWEDWLLVDYYDTETALLHSAWIRPTDIVKAGFDAPNQSLSTGYVLCETLTLRESPSAQSAKVGLMEYRATFAILEELNGWYRVQVQGAEGWVPSAYVLKDPAYYAATIETPVLAYPAADAKRVGLIDPGTELAIIAETDDYYIVSLRSASGFIAK
ncbi:MAG: SH3 domain-containing protein [Oscillospiraceae bacterium]|jgi:uncharacterized protein YgiM (DUF1202 family)|nr:SH3 domain-containing protein [Oscillospiraceae bacterium]